MNRNLNGKLKRSMRRTFALLLAVLMLSGSVLATETTMTGGTVLNNPLSVLFSHDKAQKEYESYLQGLYGNDWQEVDALQPGESYMGDEYMYVCHDDSYVQWKRIKSKEDFDGENWTGGDRLLLVTSMDGKKLALGNDYVATLSQSDGKYYTNARLIVSSYDDTSPELDNDSSEYVDVYRYPELVEYVTNSTEAYPYPDSFQTQGTMNAPYLRYMGKDGDNGDNPMFRIILSKDNGEKSANGLGLDSDGNSLWIESAQKSDKVTFEMKTKNGNTFLNMFYNVSWDDDVYLVWGEKYDFYNSYTEPQGQSFVAYVGRKYESKRIDVYSLDPDAAQDPDNLENVYGGSIEIYRWCNVYSEWFNPRYSNPRSLAEQYKPGSRMMLVWDDKYFLSGDDFRVKDDESGMALYVNEGNTSGVVAGNLAEHPEIKPEHLEGYGKEPYFYTADGMGTPYLYYQGRHDDDFYDYSPMFTIQLAGADDKPSGKWLCDADNALGICREEEGQNFKTEGPLEVSMWDWEKEHYKKVSGSGVREEHRAIFIFGNGSSATLPTNEDNDCRDPEAVKVVFEDYGYDTGLKVNGNVLYGDDDGDDWNFKELKMYIGNKVTIPAVRQDYIVGEDQFMHISQNGAMLQDVTIIVKKGGVLSVESWFMNNGRIIVDGGTLIVQDGAQMVPYLDINPAISGTLDLINGGELIVMNNARAALGRFSAASGSSVFNNGTLLTETLALRNASLENRSALFAGYNIQEMNGFTNWTVDEVVAGVVTRLQEGVTCISQWLNSSIQNDGKIWYATNQTWIDESSVKQVGTGEYLKLRGKESRFTPKTS